MPVSLTVLKVSQKKKLYWHWAGGRFLLVSLIIISLIQIFVKWKDFSEFICQVNALHIHNVVLICIYFISTAKLAKNTLR